MFSKFPSVGHIVRDKKILDLSDYIVVRHPNRYEVLKNRRSTKRLLTEAEHKMFLLEALNPLVFDSRYLEKDDKGGVRLI